MRHLKFHPTSAPIGVGVLTAAVLLLAGCYGTTGSPYATDEPMYPTGQPTYTYGQPAYANGQPVYSTPYPNGQPVYSPSYPNGQDDYVYYPDAGVYYSTTRHEYMYPESSGWVRRYDPPPVSTWGPSVHLWFHDSPERHHAEVMRAYPRHWHGDPRSRRHDRDWDDDRR